MEVPGRQVTVVGPEPDHVIGGTGRRQRGAVKGRREEATIGRTCREQLLRGGRAGEHPAPVHDRDAGPAKGRAVGKNVDGQVVAVRPDAELGVVGEVRVAPVEPVSVVRAGRVTAGRDGHAHHVRQRGDRELSHEPAVGDLVIEDRRVAVVVGLAATSESAPDGFDRNRSIDRRTALIEDREIGVDDLEVVVGSGRAVGVRRSRVHREGPRRSAETIPDAREVIESGGHRRRQRAGTGSRRVGGLVSLRLFRQRSVRFLVVALVVADLTLRDQRCRDVVIGGGDDDRTWAPRRRRRGVGRGPHTEGDSSEKHRKDTKPRFGDEHPALPEPAAERRAVNQAITRAALSRRPAAPDLPC